MRHCESMGNVGVPFPDFHPDDPPLTKNGRIEAKKLSLLFNPCDDIRIYASTLIRACETAQPTAERLGVPITVLPELMEVGTAVPGTELQHIAALAPRALDSAEQTLPPLFEAGLSYENEDAAHCIERAKRAFSIIRDAAGPGDRVLAVSHGAFFGYLLREALGISLPETFCWQVDNCAVTDILFQPGKLPKLRYSNDKRHLLY